MRRSYFRLTRLGALGRGSASPFLRSALLNESGNCATRARRRADERHQSQLANADSFAGYIRALAKTGLPSAAKARDLVGRHLTDLAILAATEPSLGESQIDCVVAAHRVAALDYIASHFCDPSLSGSSLAKKLGISQRYLQRLLEATGKTFTEHVNELRLDRAFSLLVTMDANKRVSDIALDVGYSDLTTFYTHFKSRFGDTPKQVAGRAPTDEPQRH